MKVNVNGVLLAYTDQGEGTPVVFLHAYPLGRAMWEPQVRALSPVCRVIAPDLRGHGESDAPLWLTTMDTFIEDVRGLLDRLSIREAVLAGLSMGGYIAFGFYRKYRDRVKGLILADTRAQADTPEARRSRFEAAQSAYQKGAGVIADLMIPKLFGPAAYAGRPELVEMVRRMILTTPVSGIVCDLMALSERPDSVPLLLEIGCPTLIIVGEQDGLTPPDVARFMAERIPGAGLEVIPGSGHLPNLENPEAFNRAVRRFIESLTNPKH
jgi:pimeloyl-ACP methyl ester carboxylesterase